MSNIEDLGGVFKMEFQKEYKYCRDLDPDKILEIAFDF